MSFVGKIRQRRRDRSATEHTASVRAVAAGCVAFIAAPEHMRGDCVNLSHTLTGPFRLNAVERHLTQTVHNVVICEVQGADAQGRDVWFLLAATIARLEALHGAVGADAVNLADYGDVLDVRHEPPDAEAYAALRAEWLFSKAPLNLVFLAQ